MDRRFRVLTALPLLPVLGAVIAVVPLRGARRDPETSRQMAGRAESALRAARASGADTWAPQSLRWARDAYSVGLFEARRQELRIFPLRDHRKAEESLESAIDFAEQAERIARRRSLRIEGSAKSALTEAAAAVAMLGGVEEVVWLPPRTRKKLQDARALAASAAMLVEQGVHQRSSERAHEATRLAREAVSAIVEATSRFSALQELNQWAGWADETIGWSARTGRPAIVVSKDEHQLTLYEAGRLVLTYGVDLGWNNVGDKRSQGDGATPEGRYFISEKKGAGRSRYHRALVLDYPNAADLRELAQLERSGHVPMGTRPGGLVEVHGEGGRASDWTNGCVAIANDAIEELFHRVTVGTPVTIVGGRSGSGVFSEVARRLGG